MGRSNVIGILSGKGGVGKTTLVSNLGSALASEFNRKILLIDSNVKTSHLGLHLGLYEELPVTLKDVLLKKAPVMYAVFLHPATGLRLLPAPIKGNMDLKKMDGVIRELRPAYDPILIDCAPGLGRDVVIAAKAIDKAILVTTPNLPAFTDMLKTINLLKKLRKDIIGIVVNKVKNEKYELTVEEIESTCGYDVISIIPETNKVPESIAKGMPIVMNSDCSASVEFKRLAASLIGEEYQPVGFWYKLRDMFNIKRHTARKLPKDVFVRDMDIGDEIPKATRERGEEEQTAIEELRRDLKKSLKEKKGLKVEYDDTEYLEREIMGRVKEKLRERLEE
jgi:septum site-determining protein MinD